MKNQSKMRWTKSDYITLGKAVSQFNKKINELNREEKKLYLPDLKNYETVKHNIISRNEFNRIIKSLKGFSKQGAENLYTTQTGEQITQWERKELAKESLIAERRLKAELNSFNFSNNKKSETNLQYKSPYTKAQERAMEYQEILAQIRNFKKIEQKRGIEFTRLKDRLKKLGNLDYEYMKATIYRENFMKAFEHAKNLDGYDLLMKKFNRIKNPINFYNYISQSNVFKDIFIYYKPR